MNNTAYFTSKTPSEGSQEAKFTKDYPPKGLMVTGRAKSPNNKNVNVFGIGSAYSSAWRKPHLSESINKIPQRLHKLCSDS